MRSSILNDFINLDDCLTRYVDVHNVILKQKLLQKIDYRGLIYELDDLSKSLLTIDYSFRHGNDLTREQFDSINLYIEKLLVTISKLRDIIQDLRNKAEGNKKYKWSRYRDDLKEYDTFVKDYLTAGTKVNDIYTELHNL